VELFYWFSVCRNRFRPFRVCAVGTQSGLGAVYLSPYQFPYETTQLYYKSREISTNAWENPMDSEISRFIFGTQIRFELEELSIKDSDL